MYSFGCVYYCKKLIVDSFNYIELTVAIDGSEDLLIHCLELNQPCKTGLDFLKGLHNIVPYTREDLSETSEGLLINI